MLKMLKRIHAQQVEVIAEVAEAINHTGNIHKSVKEEPLELAGNTVYPTDTSLRSSFDTFSFALVPSSTESLN